MGEDDVLKLGPKFLLPISVITRVFNQTRSIHIHDGDFVG